jgi:hypothetical protein
MRFHDLELSDPKYLIKASIKIPENHNSRKGIILAHGAIINRQSLIRKENSFADYLCKELNSYVIVPDLQGDTIHKHGKTFDNYVEIFNITSKYFVEKYELETLCGFGHSLGGSIVLKSIELNKMLDGIATYGSFNGELNSRQMSLFKYFVNYMSKYNYSINLKNLINYIFDEESLRYFKNIMLNEESYRGDNYVFDFDVSIFKNMIQIVEGYINKLEKWDKPALFLFGTEDKLTKTFFKNIKHNTIKNNIIYKHAKNASHVTPCMNINFQLQKLSSIVTFFKKIQENIEKEFLIV